MTGQDGSKWVRVGIEDSGKDELRKGKIFWIPKFCK